MTINDLAQSSHRFLVRISLSHKHKSPQIEHTQHSQKQEEVMQTPIVQVVRYPSRPPLPRADLRHNRHQKRAQVAPQCRCRKRQRRTQTPHRVRRLLVEKLQLPNIRKHLRASDDEVLRNLPEYRHWRQFHIVAIVPFNDPQPHDLQHSCGYHHEDRYEEPCPHPLELSEAVFVTGEFPCHGNDELVVDRDPEEDA